MSQSHVIKALYVEDDPESARLLQKRLARFGYQVDLASDGEEGFAKWLAGSYDVLATDHDMPRKKGLDLIRELASLGPLPPTVMITGHGNETVAVEAMKLGADDYIMKDAEGRYLDLVPQRIADAFARRRLRREKLKAEAALQESEADYLALFQNSPVGILRTTPEGKLVRANKAMARMLGYEGVEELMRLFGNTLDDLWVDPDDRDMAIRELALQGNPAAIEVKLKRRNGEHFYVDAIMRIQKDGKGDTLYMEGIIMDITERKKAEKDLQAQRDLLAAICETAPYIMIVVNEDGRVESINWAGEHFCGGPKEELLGLLGGEILHCINSFDGLGCGRNPECPNCPVRSKVMHTFQTGETLHESEGRLTVRMDVADVTLDLLISTAPVKMDDRDMVLVTILDITSRKKAEDALRES